VDLSVDYPAGSVFLALLSPVVLLRLLSVSLWRLFENNVVIGFGHGGPVGQRSCVAVRSISGFVFGKCASV